MFGTCRENKRHQNLVSARGERRRGMASLPMTLMWWLPVLVLLAPYLEPVIASIPPVRVVMSRTRVELPALASRKTRPGEI